MGGEFSIYEGLAFLAIVVVSLYADLKAHSDDKPVSMKDAVLWSAIWIVLGLSFAVYVAASHGMEDASLYLAGYLLEKSLSVDNLFVIMAIFASFRIADEYQHRVLYYGILGAIVLRFVFILAGATLIELGGDIVLAIFGLFVLWSAWKMWQVSRTPQEHAVDYTKHTVVKWASKFFPVYPHVENHNFFVRKAGTASASSPASSQQNLKLYITPLFLCLIMVEIADVAFAFDSVPAIFAITKKPFLVYTSNIFAILGLRSLYFLLAAAKRSLVYLEKAVIVVLVFIGVKMILEIFESVHVSPLVSLGIVSGVLGVGVVASLFSSATSERSRL